MTRAGRCGAVRFRCVSSTPLPRVEESAGVRCKLVCSKSMQPSGASANANRLQALFRFSARAPIDIKSFSPPNSSRTGVLLKITRISAKSKGFSHGQKKAAFVVTR
jgi:hypothetical protein